MIDAVRFADVQPFAARAAKDHVSVTDTRNTLWWAERLWWSKRKGETVAEAEDGRIIGFAGLLRISAATWRIKGVWVEPAWRGRGFGDQLARCLIRQVTEEHCGSMIEAFAYNPRYYEALGFTRYGTLPNGAVKLRRVL